MLPSTPSLTFVADGVLENNCDGERGESVLVTGEEPEIVDEKKPEVIKEEGSYPLASALLLKERSDVLSENEHRALSLLTRLSESLTNRLVADFVNQEEENDEIRTKQRTEIRQCISGGRCNFLELFSISNLHPSCLQSWESLKDYQKAGVRWLCSVHEAEGSGILADEMGLGKTAQTCVFLDDLYAAHKVDQPTVVACPAGLIDNWCNEFSRWAPGRKVLKYHGTQKERKEIIELYDEAEQDFEVIITSPNMLSGKWDFSIFFKHIHFAYLIVDEAHSLKNSESRVHRQLSHKIRASRRLLLTGSPIQNEIGELRNLLSFIMHNNSSQVDLQLAVQAYSKLKGGTSPHSSEHANPLDSPPGEGTKSFSLEVECLQIILSPYILRRLKNEVLKELPVKHSRVERCDIEGWQKDLYVSELLNAKTELSKSLLILTRKTTKGGDDIISGLPDSVSTTTAPTTSSSSRFVKTLLYRLRRICNHPVLVQSYFSQDARSRLTEFCATKVKQFCGVHRKKIEEQVETWSDFEIHQFAEEYSALSEFRIPPPLFLESAKTRRMLELLREIEKVGRKCLLFSQFTTYLDVIEEVLSFHYPSIVYIRLDGTTAVAERQGMIEMFESDPTVTLFLLSTKAGGVGLNLTPANYVLLMDQDWNPQTDRQAEDRVHRLGQTRDVFVYRLCCRGTVEESILRCCQKKLDLDEAFGGHSDILSLALLQDSLSGHCSSECPTGVEAEEVTAPVVELERILEKTGGELPSTVQNEIEPVEKENKTPRSSKKSKTNTTNSRKRSKPTTTKTNGRKPTTTKTNGRKKVKSS